MQVGPEPEHDTVIDRRVRTALAARPGAVDRIVDAALRPAVTDSADAAGRRSRVWLRGVLATGIVVALLGAALIAPRWRAPESQAPASPRGTLWNEGPVTILAMPGNPITIVGSGGTPSPVPAGTASVELLGEPR
jgi:hypothetical protein